MITISRSDEKSSWILAKEEENRQIKTKCSSAASRKQKDRVKSLIIAEAYFLINSKPATHCEPKTAITRLLFQFQFPFEIHPPARRLQLLVECDSMKLMKAHTSPTIEKIVIRTYGNKTAFQVHQ
ncbi:hypothetical protein T4D_2043 [Trichinella pseudospiralis]|uniref:Uncharacterized protein n=1 Tax=Trichinella pseudospiralis TaxID=6337 RepID=A0A0V1FMC8_TRIPS|nr:hypothetical protein T4D_2043 [Trichinella pseudospiralis]